MKELIALLFAICITAITIYLAVNKQIGTKLTAVFLIFAVLAGLAIANYDLFKRFKWWGVELEAFERKVETIKDETLQEIGREIQTHKESINLLISTLNDTREKIDLQRRTVESLVERIEQQQKSLQDIANRADTTKNRVESLHKASSDLALLLTKITWLQTETKHEFDTNRAQKAIKQIENKLNEILAVIIPDRQERSKWVQDLQSSLPPEGK